MDGRANVQNLGLHRVHVWAKCEHMEKVPVELHKTTTEFSYMIIEVLNIVK